MPPPLGPHLFEKMAFPPDGEQPRCRGDTPAVLDCATWPISSFSPTCTTPSSWASRLDYLLRVAELSRDLPAALERLGRSSPFWRLSPPA